MFNYSDGGMIQLQMEHTLKKFYLFVTSGRDGTLTFIASTDTFVDSSLGLTMNGVSVSPVLYWKPQKKILS